MAVVGFIDITGQEVRFEDIQNGAGNFGDTPRAVIRSLARQERKPDHYGDPSVVSVTTIINPVQQTRLVQRHDLFVDPMSRIWSTYGTVSHGFFEAGAQPTDIVEHKLVIERDGVKIGGTFDLLEFTTTSGATVAIYQGRDYKVTSAYSVKGMLQEDVYHAKPDYFWQAQLYHLMTQDPEVREVRHFKSQKDPELVLWEHAGKVSVDNWALVAICRDWNERMHGKVLPQPIATIPIRLLELSRVENYLRQRILVYKASEMCSDEGLPACTDEETWQGRRCAKYCAAYPVCHQANPVVGDVAV